ncbi:MAG: helix-turn-helix domain-containing protein [Acidimicrobiales bacterium]|nr:helix-turn-helix domain-containing protein [Acidimicrobiales bacterium]
MAASRRSYDSTLRQQQAAETRERIVTAGSELVHGTSIRDWHNVTIRAVAERAGVSERTVYRHFTNERGLRDAVMGRLEQEAGVDLESLAFDDIGKVAARVLEYVAATYTTEPREHLDPTLDEVDERRRESLRRAVADRVADWPERDRTIVAATLDLLWSLRSYEHLHLDWQLDGDDAIAGIGWVIALVEQAVRDGQRP